MVKNNEPARIRAVSADDAELVRDFYLRMLADSPDAFGETLDNAQRRTTAEWQAFVNHCVVGNEIIAFIGEDTRGSCGFVRGELGDPRTPPGTVLVSELWVAPEQRSLGLGRELMNSVTRWAEARHAIRISLGVAEKNLAVQGFYKKLGYADTGRRVPLPSNETLQVVVMVRTV